MTQSGHRRLHDRRFPYDGGEPRLEGDWKTS
jgi:hypothetical protein